MHLDCQSSLLQLDGLHLKEELSLRSIEQASNGKEEKS